MVVYSVHTLAATSLPGAGGIDTGGALSDAPRRSDGSYIVIRADPETSDLQYGADRLIEFYSGHGTADGAPVLLKTAKVSAVLLGAHSVRFSLAPVEERIITDVKVISTSAVPVFGTPADAVPIVAFVVEIILDEPGTTEKISRVKRAVYATGIFPFGFPIFKANALPGGDGLMADAAGSFPLGATYTQFGDTRPDGFGSGGVSGISATFDKTTDLTLLRDCMVAVADATNGNVYIVNVNVFEAVPAGSDAAGHTIVVPPGATTETGPYWLQRNNIGVIRTGAKTAAISSAAATPGNTAIAVCTGASAQTGASFVMWQEAILTKVRVFHRTSVFSTDSCVYEELFQEVNINAAGGGAAADPRGILDAKLSASGSSLAILSYPCLRTTNGGAHYAVSGSATALSAGGEIWLHVPEVVNAALRKAARDGILEPEGRPRWIRTGVIAVTAPKFGFLSSVRGKVAGEVVAAPARLSLFSMSWSGRSLFIAGAADTGDKFGVTWREYSRAPPEFDAAYAALENGVRASSTKADLLAIFKQRIEMWRLNLQKLAPALACSDGPAPLSEWSDGGIVVPVPQTPATYAAQLINVAGIHTDYFGTVIGVARQYLIDSAEAPPPQEFLKNILVSGAPPLVLLRPANPLNPETPYPGAANARFIDDPRAPLPRPLTSPASLLKGLPKTTRPHTVYPANAEGLADLAAARAQPQTFINISRLELFNSLSDAEIKGVKLQAQLDEAELVLDRAGEAAKDLPQYAIPSVT